MFRHELSDFLRAVLDAVHELPRGVGADAEGYPQGEETRTIARALGATPDEVEQALIGLRAAHCLVEQSVEFEGLEPLFWWVVHPQCARDSSATPVRPRAVDSAERRSD